MRVSSEFSKYAQHYNSRNIIQNKVVDKLIESIDSKPKSILDLGCGSGALCKKIDWEYDSFLGVDFADGMLKLHPKGKNINTMYGDFNDEKLFEKLKLNSFDYIVSASALQWAKDLDSVFHHIQTLNAPIALAIFTSNTFKILNETALLKPILKSVDEIDQLQKKHFNVNFEVIEYRLEFDSVREMFKYIKQSGVSGSRKVLDYKQTKKLMENYPVNYLEFEVVFITSR